MKKRIAKIELTEQPAEAEQPKQAAQPAEGELTDKDMEAVAGGVGSLTLNTPNLGANLNIDLTPKRPGTSGINALGTIGGFRPN